MPSHRPTTFPTTAHPTAVPTTAHPTAVPTTVPSIAPTVRPSRPATQMPTTLPTTAPTFMPSVPASKFQEEGFEGYAREVDNVLLASTRGALTNLQNALNESEDV